MPRTHRQTMVEAHSLSKYESRLNHIIGGPLVFEIWRHPSGHLCTSFWET